MSWDAVKERYGYKEISIATWRDPMLSVHPARGGPKTPTISPESAAKPFIPRYKVRYPVPEPTDDEDEDDEKENKEDEGKKQDDEAKKEDEVEKQDVDEEKKTDGEPQAAEAQPAGMLSNVVLQ